MDDIRLPYSTPEPRQKRDDISAFSIALLLLLVLYQFVAQSGIIEKRILKVKAKVHSHSAPTQADADAYLTIDVAAKMAYVQFLLPAAFRSAKEAKALPETLDTALTEYKKSPSDPGIARRVILLRAELGQADPLGPIPAKGKRKALPAPIKAFEYPELAGSRTVLTDLFAPKVGRPPDYQALARRVKADSTLRWYRHLALHQIYMRASDKVNADRQLRQAGDEAAKSLMPVGGIVLAMLVAGFFGIVLLLHELIHSRARRSAKDQQELQPLAEAVLVPEQKDSMWPDVPELPNRQLGAGDLFNVFVCYMFAFAVLEIIADVIVYQLVLHRPAYVKSHVSSLELWMGLAHQVATAICAFVVLLWYVRSRGSTLAREVWLRVDPLWTNVGYGVAGWSMGLPLMAIAALVSSVAFSKLSNPSNPVIMMITTSHGFLARFLLFFMACILAPILEETMFRGAFYQAARARIGVWPGIIVTGILFGGIHPVGLAGAVPLMVLGSVFAWMAEKRKSLVPGMVAHCLVNAATYFQLIALAG